MYVLRFPFNVLLAKARSYLRAFIPAEYTFPQNIPPRSAALLALKSYNFYITPPPMHDVWWGRFWSPADIPRLNNLALDLDFPLRVEIKIRFRRTSRTVLSTPPCLLCLLTGLLKSSVAGHCQYIPIAGRHSHQRRAISEAQQNTIGKPTLAARVSIYMYVHSFVNHCFPQRGTRGRRAQLNYDAK